MQYGLSLGADSVVPFAVEIFTCDSNAGHLLVSDFYLRRVILTVENTSNFKTRLCARVRYQVHNGGVCQQWLAAPVLSDIRKQAMLDLVPFTCPGWEVANRDSQSRSICHFL